MIPPSVSFATYTYLPTRGRGTKPERVEDVVRPRRGRDEMSRAFVKEPDEGAPDEGLPERQISDHPNYVTPAGLRQLEQKLGELEERRLELLAAAEDDDALARGQLDYIDRDLRYFTRRFETALLVEPRRQPRRMVKFGAAVTVIEQGGARRTFTIVGEDEADLKAGKISYVSPAGDGLRRRRRPAASSLEHRRQIRRCGSFAEQQAGHAFLRVPTVGAIRVVVGHHRQRPALLPSFEPCRLQHQPVVHAQPAALEERLPARRPRGRRDAPALHRRDARQQLAGEGATRRRHVALQVEEEARLVGGRDSTVEPAGARLEVLHARERRDSLQALAADDAVDGVGAGVIGLLDHRRGDAVERRVGRGPGAQVGDEQHRLDEARALEGRVGVQARDLAAAVHDGHADLAGATAGPVQRPGDGLPAGEGGRERRENPELRRPGRRLRTPGRVAQVNKVGVTAGREVGANGDGVDAFGWHGRAETLRLDLPAVLRQHGQRRREQPAAAAARPPRARLVDRPWGRAAHGLILQVRRGMPVRAKPAVGGAAW